MASSPRPAATVRPAVRSDLPRILQIERAAHGAAHWAESDYEAALTSATPRRWLYVAEVQAQAQEQVEAFLVARSAHSSEWEIENVVVAAPARRLGLATALLRTFLDRIRSEKSANETLVAHLEVRESNLAARSLYEKSGFTLDKKRTAYYRLPEEDALLYHLIYQ